MANVGKNIRNIRTKNKMTQDELGGKLFVSRQTVSNYETGKSNPDIDMLIKIAEALDTDVNILIFGVPTPPDKKKEYLHLGISIFIILLLGILIAIAKPQLKIWSESTFHIGLTIALQVSVYPAFLFCIGRCVMQASGAFLGAKPLAGQISRVIHYSIVLFLIIYGIMILPFCITEIQYALKLIRYMNANAGVTGVPDIFHTTDRLFQRLVYNLFYFLYHFLQKYSLVYGFFFLGAAFWGTKPVRRNEAKEKEVEKKGMKNGDKK